MEGERYGALRAQILEASHAPRFTPRAERTPGAAVYECVRQAWRKLERRVDDLGPNPKDEELHRVRISAKRCRYAVEAIQPFAKRRARRFLRRVARLQDILGELHDVSVERARLRNAMTNDSAAFVAGELAGLDVVARERARKAWGRAWKKVANKRLRFWKSHSAFPDGRPTTSYEYQRTLPGPGHCRRSGFGAGRRSRRVAPGGAATHAIPARRPWRRDEILPR